MVDWSRAFRRASFRGVPFWVENESPEKGRRIASHEISGGEAPVTEDMGRRARSIYVRAYVAGDRAIANGAALEMVCEAPGASLLILPMDPGQLVHCVSCARNRTRDKNGFIAYDLDFAEAASGGFGIALPGGRISAAFSAGSAGFAVSIAAIF